LNIAWTAITTKRTIAKARFGAWGAGSPRGFLQNVKYECKLITSENDKNEPSNETDNRSNEQETAETLNTTLEGVSKLSKQVPNQNSPPKMYQNILLNHLFGGGVITFLPFFARRRAAIGPSRPTLSDTPNLVQTSAADRVCHSRAEMSTNEKSED
jgi:hypothetical protein